MKFINKFLIKRSLYNQRFSFPYHSPAVVRNKINVQKVNKAEEYTCSNKKVSTKLGTLGTINSRNKIMFVNLYCLNNKIVILT